MIPRITDRFSSPGRAWGGLALFSSVLLAMPVLSSQHLSQIQALNRELGKLCGNPPREALTVCRIHARLVSAF